VASDDEAAAAQVQAMIERFGFDALYSGPLRTGQAFEPGTAIFDGVLRREDLQAELEQSCAQHV
jgi:8-hydroxy-5-deazaflavin:NADPH oxidoreductase